MLQSAVIEICDEVERSTTFSEDQPQTSHHLFSPQLNHIETSSLLETEMQTHSISRDLRLTDFSATQSFSHGSPDAANSMTPTTFTCQLLPVVPQSPFSHLKISTEQQNTPNHASLHHNTPLLLPHPNNNLPPPPQTSRPHRHLNLRNRQRPPLSLSIRLCRLRRRNSQTKLHRLSWRHWRCTHTL